VIDGRGIGCRFGGDEYIVALRDAGVDETAAVGEEIRRAIGEHAYVKDGIDLHPGISIGVAAFPASADTAHGLFQRADAALYRAKAAGKNRVCS
jgi:diguanylate cyclase (GGDEF)-like protein